MGIITKQFERLIPIGLVGLLLGVVCAKADELVVVSDAGLPTTIAGQSYTLDPVLVPRLHVLRVLRLGDGPEISNTVVVLDPIDVVDVLGEPPVHDEPCDPVGANLLSANLDVPVSCVVSGSRQLPISGKYAGLGVVMEIIWYIHEGSLSVIQRGVKV